MSHPEPINPVEATAPVPADATSLPIKSPPGTITLGTLVSYLFGSREAILSLASHRHTLWLGLIFVISAGFAREYDGEDLLHEPWHLLLPLVASLATSFVLFCLVSWVGWCRGAGLSGFWNRYRSFLSLYWMTAPLAWMYAIPVERFLSESSAPSANVYLLAVVSLWRVLLIVRVFSVLYSASAVTLFFVVMLFADTLAITLVSWIDVQIFAVMGGVRLNAAESALAGIKVIVLFFGVLGWPIWLIGTIVVASSESPTWSWTPAANSAARYVSTPVWTLAIASLAVWGFILPWTQPAQQLRGAAERDLRAGRYREALTTMSTHPREEFPPHWDPPPSIGASRERVRILKIIPAMSPETAPWVRELFVRKFEAALGIKDHPHETLWVEADAAEILSILESLPNRDEILRRHRYNLQALSYERYPLSVKAKQKINATRLRLVEIPDELTGDSRERQWSEPYASAYHEYVWQLREIDDRPLVLKVHGERLRKVLDRPEFVPERVLISIREVLGVPAVPKKPNGPRQGTR